MEFCENSTSCVSPNGNTDTSLIQQGTGARRALFWAMLQVHNELTRDDEIRDEFRKKMKKVLDDEKKKKPKNLNLEQLAEVERRIDEINAILKAHEDGAPIPESPDDPALPGYLLLIDEPENALHPMAARAAQRHLYKLAESPDWQVMMTTHSPYFINPFEDHTTIIRLDRVPSEDDTTIQPKTYRSDLMEFDEDDKQRLQALQNIDPTFAEIFFGSYPILVEGDTEHAAFIASIIEAQHELVDQVAIIRARGKAILVPLIKVLTHFKINFGIIHDCDSPFRSDGANNGMWTENGKIWQAIEQARAADITVRHRVSVPDFERFLGGEEESKDKPFNAYRLIKDDVALGERVQSLLRELLGGQQCQPFEVGDLATNADYLGVLHEEVMKWAISRSLENDLRYKGKG